MAEGPLIERAPRTRGFLSEVLASLRGAELDYTTHPLGRAIWLLAIPMVLEMSMESSFAIVDVFFVARLGNGAVAAVGLTEALLTIVYALGFGLAVAAGALVARRIGEVNKAGAVRAATSALALGLGAGIALGLPALLFAPRLLDWMGGSPEVVAEGAGYARLILGLNGIVLLIHLANGVFRGAGDPALALRSPRSA